MVYKEANTIQIGLTVPISPRGAPPARLAPHPSHSHNRVHGGVVCILPDCEGRGSRPASPRVAHRARRVRRSAADMVTTRSGATWTWETKEARGVRRAQDLRGRRAAHLVELRIRQGQQVLVAHPEGRRLDLRRGGGGGGVSSRAPARRGAATRLTFRYLKRVGRSSPSVSSWSSE